MTGEWPPQRLPVPLERIAQRAQGWNVTISNREINVTMSYKAVYPDEVIEAHRVFIACRHATRSGEEFRIPPDEE